MPAPTRIGLTTQLKQVEQQLTYFGLGPLENYPDRQGAAQLGLWKLDLSDAFTPYIFPSENGLRTQNQRLQYGGLLV